MVQAEIGMDDGVFWMSFNDFFRNFDDIFLCRFFDSNEYKTCFFESEWSKDNATAGGCRNTNNYIYNP